MIHRKSLVAGAVASLLAVCVFFVVEAVAFGELFSCDSVAAEVVALAGYRHPSVPC
jgi:hypothetical protein